jgi:fused signal recognition particle receptor
MFKFLKDKLKKAVSRFSKKIEEEGREEVKEVEVKPELKKQEVKKPEKKRPAEKPKAEETKAETRPKEKAGEKKEEITPKKKGFFAKLKERVMGVSELEEAPEEEFEDITVKKEKPEKPKIKKPKEIAKEKPKAEEKKEKAEFEPGIKAEELKEEIKPKIEIEGEKEIKEEAEEETKAEEKPKIPEIEAEKEEKKELVKEEKKEEEKPKAEEKEYEPAEEKKGFFAKLKEKIVTKKISAGQFENMFWDLELILLENNVAVEVIDKIKEDLKQNLVDKPLPRGRITDMIIISLKQTIEGLFEVEKIDLIKKAKEKKPFVICFVGINGSGKTTTIAKMVKMFQNNGLSCVIAASDTFRAAAIDQLQQHADNLRVKLIKHDYGSDAAAVAFDAVKHAQAKGIDIVLIDTAGRMHSNINLMEEMEKIIRVAKPDLKIFVGESITGNDCTEQAKKFNESIGIDGIVLSKADVDEKGGAAVSISYVTGKPILFIGTGQDYEDLKEFEPKIVLKSLELE